MRQYAFSWPDLCFFFLRVKFSLKPGLNVPTSCYTTFVDATMLECLALMFAQQFLLDEYMISQKSQEVRSPREVFHYFHDPTEF